MFHSSILSQKRTQSTLRIAFTHIAAKLMLIRADDASVDLDSVMQHAQRIQNVRRVYVNFIVSK